MEEEGLNMSKVSIHLIAIMLSLAQFVMVTKVYFVQTKRVQYMCKSYKIQNTPESLSRKSQDS